MRLFNLLSLGFLFLLSTCLVSQSSTFADDSTAKPITIGVLASLSGNWAGMGEMTRKGLTLAAEEINSSGGILGRKVEFRFEDTNEAVSAAKVVSAYKFLRTQKLEIFIGPSGSPGGIALAPVASRDDIVMISPSVGVRDFHIAGENLFNSQGSWELSSARLAKYAYDLGVRQIAIFSSQQPFELRQADAFEKAFRALGGAILSRQDPLPDQTDLRSEALQIVASKAPAVFYANYNQMGPSAKQLRDLGFKGSQFATLIDSSRLTGADGALDNAIFTRLTDNPIDQFSKSFRKRFGEEPGYSADFAYDALFAIAKAAVVAKSLAPSKLKAALPHVSFEGASGHFAFDTDGCVIRKPTAWRVAKEKFEFVAALE